MGIREDELDDRMTEDCNMSDGRSTFIEWVQYLMGYAAEVTPAAGAVLLDRGQFPDELYRTQDPLAKRIQNMLDGYDDALYDCLRDPDLCLAEQFLRPCRELHGDAERRDHALARHRVRRVVCRDHGQGPAAGPVYLFRSGHCGHDRGADALQVLLRGGL